MAPSYRGGGARRRPRPEQLVVFDPGSSRVLKPRSVELEAPGGADELKEVRRVGGLAGNRVRELGQRLRLWQLRAILAPFVVGTGGRLAGLYFGTLVDRWCCRR